MYAILHVRFPVKHTCLFENAKIVKSFDEYITLDEAILLYEKRGI